MVYKQEREREKAKCRSHKSCLFFPQIANQDDGEGNALSGVLPLLMGYRQWLSCICSYRQRSLHRHSMVQCQLVEACAFCAGAGGGGGGGQTACGFLCRRGLLQDQLIGNAWHDMLHRGGSILHRVLCVGYSVAQKQLMKHVCCFV